jgi:hypothetical protein
MSSRVNSEFWASAATGRDVRAPLPDLPDSPAFEAFFRSTGISPFDTDRIRQEAPRLVREFNRAQQAAFSAQTEGFTRSFDPADIPF